MELEGRVAIVTGGARGIGGATVEALCREGAFVFVADLLDEGEVLAKRLASQLRAHTDRRPRRRAPGCRTRPAPEESESSPRG